LELILRADLSSGLTLGEAAQVGIDGLLVRVTDSQPAAGVGSAINAAGVAGFLAVESTGGSFDLDLKLDGG